MPSSRHDEPHRRSESREDRDRRYASERSRSDRDRHDDRRHTRRDEGRSEREENSHKRHRHTAEERHGQSAKGSSREERASERSPEERVVPKTETQKATETDGPKLHAVAPAPAPTAEPVKLPPPLDLSNCNVSRVCVITVPPRGNFGNLTDANEEDFHFADHFYEKLLHVGVIDRIMCYRECLPNGTSRCRLVAAFMDERSAIDCVRLHDHQPYLGTKRITRCQFLPMAAYVPLLQLKPE